MMRLLNSIKTRSNDKGIDDALMTNGKHLPKRRFKEYSLIKPVEIPFRDDISKTLDPDEATNTFAGNKLMLNMKLGPVLQKWMRDIKQKYPH
ncbi:restriction endonuclease subunit R [Streptococcus salivarius]|uniref:restriction endonuclease subunit R n=1 Tax=Streptococcus salivarius TaxID=1304 RepID=UPI0019116323|nr:restriction endonuclease subunit R [Streptococcus salivarius]MBK5129562.1 restriction endonuclease subunit R [Streptococcus salivarius]